MEVGMMAQLKKTESMGEKMKKAREKRRWSLEYLADKTGYPVQVLEDVEKGKMRPPVALILQVSQALKFDMAAEDEASEKKASAIRTKSHKKRVASYAYKTLTKAHSGDHLRSYMVTIAAGEKHKGVEYKHEGEEFIYVLKGGLLLEVGKEVKRLRKDDSVLFNSGLYHKLSNPTRGTTELLVTIYIP